MSDIGPTDPLRGVSADPGTVFSALAAVIYRGSKLSDVYAGICTAATLMVPGCDHSSVMMRRDNRFATVAATDDTARQINALECAMADGPCVDSIEDEAPQVERELSASGHWPNWAARVLYETTVRSVMGFRLLVDERKIGALNLFSDTVNGFDNDSAECGIVLAAFASVAAHAVVRGDDVAMLRRGLANNLEIGKAIGMLMALHDISEQQAYDMLRDTAQQMNLSLADLARGVVKQRRRQR